MEGLYRPLILCIRLLVQNVGVWTGVLEVSGVTGVESPHTLGQEAVESGRACSDAPLPSS